MNDNCPTCGQNVKVCISDEGTGHYEGVEADENKILKAALNKIINRARGRLGYQVIDDVVSIASNALLWPIGSNLNLGNTP